MSELNPMNWVSWWLLTIPFCFEPRVSPNVELRLPQSYCAICSNFKVMPEKSCQRSWCVIIHYIAVIVCQMTTPDCAACLRSQSKVWLPLCFAGLGLAAPAERDPPRFCRILDFSWTEPGEENIKQLWESQHHWKHWAGQQDSLGRWQGREGKARQGLVVWWNVDIAVRSPCLNTDWPEPLQSSLLTSRHCQPPLYQHH